MTVGSSLFYGRFTDEYWLFHYRIDVTWEIRAGTSGALSSRSSAWKAFGVQWLCRKMWRKGGSFWLREEHDKGIEESLQQVKRFTKLWFNYTKQENNMRWGWWNRPGLDHAKEIRFILRAVASHWRILRKWHDQVGSLENSSQKSLEQ
jgi:hypothetical protein